MTVIDDFTVDAVASLPVADRVQYELAEIDESFHISYGRDESGWLPAQVAAYNAAIGRVWAAPERRCPVCRRTFEDCRCTGVTA